MNIHLLLFSLILSLSQSKNILNYTLGFEYDLSSPSNSLTNSLTNLSSGNIIFIWQTTESSDYYLYGKITDLSGNIISPQFQINLETTQNQDKASVIGLINGGFVITWHKYINFANAFDIVYTIFYDNNNISNRTGELKANTYTKYNQIEPLVTFLHTGGFFIAWSSYLQDSSEYGVFGKLFNENYEPGFEFQLNTITPNNQTLSSLCTLLNGNIVIVWTSFITKTSTDVITQDEIYAQIITENGLFYNENFLVNTVSYRNQSYPAVDRLQDGGFVVVWLSYYPTSYKYNIKGQIFDSKGLTKASEVLISKYAMMIRFLHYPVVSVIGLSKGGFLCLYFHQYGSGGNRQNYGFYGQFMDSNGNKIKSEFNINKTLQTYPFTKPLATRTIESNEMVVFLNGKDGNLFKPFTLFYKLDFDNEVLELDYNEIPLKQAENLLIKENMIKSASKVYFYIISYKNGQFEKEGNLIKKFSNEEISKGLIYFNHFGAPEIPSVLIQMKLIDDIYVTSEQIYLKFNYTNLPKTSSIVITNNFFDFTDKTILQVTENNLKASSTLNTKITYYIYQLINCHFENIQNPKEIIQFSTDSVKNQSLTLIVDSTYSQSSFSFVISDGVSVTEPIEGNITKNSLKISLNRIFESEFRIDSNNTRNPFSPFVVMQKSGDFFISWTGLAPDIAAQNIYGQFFDLNCEKLGVETEINDFILLAQLNQHFAYTDKGTLIGVWSSNAIPPNNYFSAIFGKAFKANSRTPIVDFQISSAYSSSLYYFNRDNPSIIGGPNNEFIVVWESATENRPFDIFLRKYNSYSYPLGEEIMVNSFKEGKQEKPDIARFSNGDFIVVWQGEGQDDYEIYGQLFFWNLTKIGEEFQVNIYSKNKQNNPKVAILDEERFIIVYESNGNDGDGFGIFGRILNSKTLNLSSENEFQINTYFKGTQKNPSIAILNDGFVIVWESHYEKLVLNQILGQLFDFNGIKIGTEFQINRFKGVPSFPRVSSDLTSCFVVAWLSFGQEISDMLQVFGQKFCKSNKEKSPTLMKQNQEYLLALDSELSDNDRPSLAADSGRYIAVWESYNNTPNSTYSWDIIGQVYDNYSNAIGSRFIINTQREETQKFPTIQGSNLGYFVVTWASYGQDGDGYGVYGQILDLNGEKIEGEFLVNTNTKGDQERPRVSINKLGLYVITWDSNTNGSYNVYGQKFKLPHVKIGEEFQINDIIPSNVKASGPEISINSKGDFLVVWFGDNFGIFGHFFHFYEERDYEDFRISNYYQMTYIHVKRIYLYDDGNFIVSFDCESSADGFMDGSYRGVFAQLFKVQGLELIEVTDFFQVNSFVLGDQVLNNIIAYSDEFLIVWDSSQNDGSDRGVFGQKFDKYGKKIGYEIQINTISNGNQVYPTIAMSSTGHMMILWYSYGNEVAGFEIKAQNYMFIDDTLKKQQDLLGLEMVFSIENIDPLDLLISNDDKWLFLLKTNGILVVFEKIGINFLKQVARKTLDISSVCCFVRIDQKLIIASLSNTLVIIDITIPENPIFEGVHSLEISPIDMKIEGNHLFLINQDSLLQIYEILFKISDINEIKLLKSIGISTKLIKIFYVYDKKFYFLLDSIENLFVIYSYDNNYNLTFLSQTSLLGSGNSFDISKNGAFAVIGSNYGLEILDLRNRPISIAFSLALSRITDIKYSPNQKYISVCISNNFFIYNIENPLNPFQVTKLLSLKSVIKKSYFSVINEEYCYVLNEDINIVKNIFPKSVNFIPRFTLGALQTINEGDSSFITLSLDRKSIIVGNSNESLVLDMSNLNGSSLPIIKRLNGLKEIKSLVLGDNDYSYSINETMLCVYLGFGFDFTFLAGILIDKPIEILLNNAKNRLFMITSDRFMVITVPNLTILSENKLDSIKDDKPYKMLLTNEENYLFIACGKDPLILIDLHMINNLIFHYPLDYSSIILDLAYLVKDNKSFVLITGSQSLIIYEFIKNEGIVKLVLVSDKTIAPHTQGLILFKNNSDFVILQSLGTLFLVSISNLSYPIIFDRVNTKIFNSNSKNVLLDDRYLIFPTVEVIGLFSHQIDLLPSIKASNYNQQKRFDISFYAFSLVSNTNENQTTKILKIDSKPTLPDWITIDISNGIISFFPTSIEDLYLISRQIIEVTFSKKLNENLFSDEEKLTLVNQGGDIYSNGYVSLNFDPNSDLVSKNVIFVLSQNFFKYNFLFAVEQFLTLNRKPVYILDITAQFQRAYPSYININTKIDFQFNIDSFQDPDDDEIIYSVVNLPKFLNFDSQIRRITGIASKTDIGNYSIEITANDHFQMENATLIIEINNKGPTLKKSSAISTQKLSLGKAFVLDIPKDLFQDPEQDILTLAVSYKDKNLPNWMTFNKDLGRFTGSPAMKDIAFYPKERKYYQEFIITINASDIAENYMISSFKLIYYSEAPILNPLKPLQKQFDENIMKILGSPTPELNTIYEISFDLDTFIDKNGDILTYSAYLNQDSPLPEWMKFDAINFKLLLQPTDSQLNEHYSLIIIADNGFQKVSGTLKFKFNASVIYVVWLLVKIFGPFLGIFGILKYRSYVVLLFCKRKYQYSHYEKIKVGKSFHKQIYLINDDLNIGKRIFGYIKDNNKDWMLSLIIDSDTDQEQFSGLLISIRARLELKDRDLFIDDRLLMPGKTLFVIIQCLMMKHMIKYYPNAYKKYKHFKKTLKRKHNKNWYFQLIKMAEGERDIEVNKFPEIQINEKKLADLLDLTELPSRFLFWKGKKKIATTIIEFKLMLGLLKADVLGISLKTKKPYIIWKNCKGESILLPPSEINSMESRLIMQSNSRIIQSLKQILFLNYRILDDPLKQLPPWLSYNIHNGILQFEGVPTEKDVGIFGIRILDKNRIIIRELQIKVQSDFFDNRKKTRRTVNLEESILKMKKSFEVQKSILKSGSLVKSPKFHLSGAIKGKIRVMKCEIAEKDTKILDLNRE